jgi:hypothetical protein
MKMKSFDEWWKKDHYNLVGHDKEKDYKDIADDAWLAAQEVQRDSDAVVAEIESTLFSNVICEKIIVAMRNNKAV